MTERGENDTEYKDDEMADMNYRNFVDEDDAGHVSDDTNPTADGGNALHAVNVEPSVEMAGGQSSAPGPRKLRGGMMMYKSVGCSKAAAICLLLLILCSILLIAIVASFARPRCLLSNNATSATESPPSSSPVMCDDGKQCVWQDVRLPDQIKPWNYTVFLHPNLTTNQVTGHVEIVLNVVESVNFIVFHAVDMNITKPSKIVRRGSNSETINVLRMQRTAEDEVNEQVYLKLASKMTQGRQYVLKLDFDYTLANGLNGFYRSTYKVGEEDRVLATTQFEPTDARKAFPCFDEPNLKATFQLTLIREKRHITLSNMPQSSSTPYTGSKSSPGLMQDEYTQSVIMSTYLVAFVVCDFKNINGTAATSPIPTQVAVYASEDKLNQTQLALDVLTSTIPEYETYFGVKYPLPKQDMIAIPDFAAGAMENWGLITYRQASILHQEGVTSDSSKQWIVQTITHELAHQWFGNIVTMDWWTDLWLNEGFATYVEYLGTDAFDKLKKLNWRVWFGNIVTMDWWTDLWLNEGFATYVMYVGTDMWQAGDNRGWRMMDQFIVSTVQSAMYTDSLSDSHPIQVEVHSPGEINEIFDSISYSKGASIILMLNNYVTNDVFRDGLTSYLKKFQYSNAKTADLWNAIANAKKDVGDHTDLNEIPDMMDTWTKQMGYPVVTFTRNGGTLTARQKQFLIYSKGKPSKDFPSDYNYKWTIPLSVVFASNPKPETVDAAQKTLFTKDQDTTTLKINPNVQWYKANYKQNGFYRVNYDAQNWNQLKDQLLRDDTVFHVTDKAGIIDDAFNLAWSGQLNYMIPLEITRYLNNEEDYIPWSAALSGLGSIGVVLRSKEGYPYYTKYTLNLLDNLLNKIKWEDTGEHLKKFLRDSVFYRAVIYGHPKSVEEAKMKFKAWKDNNEKVSANLKRAIYCGGVMYGNEDDWDYVWNQYQDSIIPTEKRMLQKALACTYNPMLINKYLYLSIDKTKIRQQDSINVIESVASHPAGASTAVKFVIDNWDVIIKRYGKSSFDLSDLIGSVTYSISSQFEYDQIKSFLSKNKEAAKSGRRAINQAMETMQMNINWLKKNEEIVTQWFKNNV